MTDAERLAAELREWAEGYRQNLPATAVKLDQAAAELTRLSAEVAALRTDAALLSDMAQFMDAMKPDLGNQWSVWDQSVRDRITARLRALAATAGDAIRPQTVEKE